MDFKEQVKNSFSACKKDISKLFEENLNLREEIRSLKDENKELTNLISSLKESIQKIENSLNKKDTIVEEPIKTQITSDPYEALLAFKAKKNKREMLKKKMVSLISENGISLSELKFMFVNHFKYCSKATFYNYLKELELEREIVIQRERTKNVVYLPGLKRHI